MQKNYGIIVKIKENKKAPSFILPSTGCVNFDLKNIKGKLLIYFYPKDDTPGCTMETKDFSKLYKKFKKINNEFSTSLNQLSGQALHAKTLEFKHPTTKKWISFNSDLPRSFKKILKLLENLSS